MTFTRLQFDYNNHRGDDHTYVVAPMSIAFEQHPLPDSDEQGFSWMLRAQVLKRDGECRPGIRSFQLRGLKNVEEVPYE